MTCALADIPQTDYTKTAERLNAEMQLSPIEDIVADIAAERNAPSGVRCDAREKKNQRGCCCAG